MNITYVKVCIFIQISHAYIYIYECIIYTFYLERVGSPSLWFLVILRSLTLGGPTHSQDLLLCDSSQNGLKSHAF